jgi:hypothetical protein
MGATSIQFLFLVCTIKIKPGSKDQQGGARLLRVNLESGQVETLSAQIRKPYAATASREALTSRAGLIAYLHYDGATSRETLTILNPETLEEQQVHLEDSVTGFRWSADGDKLGFLTQASELGIFSVPELKVAKLKEVKGYDLRWPSQAMEWSRDNRLILRRLEGKDSLICLLDAELEEQKAMPVPFTTRYPAPIWSAGKYVIVEDTERHQLWTLDLDTEKWLRIY